MVAAWKMNWRSETEIKNSLKPLLYYFRRAEDLNQANSSWKRKEQDEIKRYLGCRFDCACCWGNRNNFRYLRTT